MSEAITIREVHGAVVAHEKLDDTRFDTVCRTMNRVETAIADHAKASAELSERTSHRMHERMDGLVASITKLDDKLESVQGALNTRINSVESGSNGRINGIVWGGLILFATAAGWLAIQIIGSLQ